MRLGIVGIRWSSIAGAVLVALSMVGCAGRGNVSGKVTFQNKSLLWGTVLIEGSDGGHRQGSIEGRHLLRRGFGHGRSQGGGE